MQITPRIALEILGHEAIVPEAYKDGTGVWTWGVGVTNASGHPVHPRYLDNPQPLEDCLKVFVKLLEDTYAPPVRRAFAGVLLGEHQLGAALSFHWNTGAIERAGWVQRWRQGDGPAARAAFMEWTKPDIIRRRREKECALFFDGVWSGSGRVLVIPVKKPDYLPDMEKAQHVDVSDLLQRLLGKA